MTTESKSVRTNATRGARTPLREVVQQQAWQNEMLQERLAELELALEDIGWQRTLQQGERDFSREGLRQICRMARLMWIKNPLIKRGVNVQMQYVMGQGVSIRADDSDVNAVVQAFLDDSKNQTELTSQQALQQKETDLQLFANVFFVFFTNPASGRVRIRTISMDEIDEILCNPEDSKDPWLYKRTWTEESLEGETVTHTAYYPDWRYQPRQRPDTVRGVAVRWDSPIYHIKTNCLSDMRFGVSEVYAAIDWAKAYKEFLEDWATIVRAYSRFAWSLTTKGGKAGVAAAKAKLGTTYAKASTGTETNPPPVAASTFIATEGVKMEPLRTAGATTSAEDGRRLLLMVAASTGLPESFFGDVSVGTLATAKSLDRPTELQMRSRQSLWSSVLIAILTYVIVVAVRAGLLPGTLEDEEDGTPKVVLPPDPETGDERKATVSVTWPPILEHDVNQSVQSIISAATLDGKALAGTIPDIKALARMLLTALGESDVDAALEMLFPENEPATTPGQSEQPIQDKTSPTEAMMTEAVRELRGAIKQFVERHA